MRFAGAYRMPPYDFYDTCSVEADPASARKGSPRRGSEAIWIAILAGGKYTIIKLAKFGASEPNFD